MRLLAVTLLMLAALCSANHIAQAQASSCKVCSDWQDTCIKNYAGPTCKSGYQMCKKACGKKS